MPNTHTTLTNLFSDIADAIRLKTGSDETIIADNFPEAISNISSNATQPYVEYEAEKNYGQILSAKLYGFTIIPQGFFSNYNLVNGIQDMTNTITTIHNDAFYNTRLQELVIPPNVTSIGQNVFYLCSSLNKITIPEHCTSIGNYCFYNDTKLHHVIVLNLVPPSLGSNAFTGVTNFTIYVPQASLAAYQTASGWSQYRDNIVAITE